jgi:hypothetical protein
MSHMGPSLAKDMTHVPYGSLLSIASLAKDMTHVPYGP